MEFSRRSILKWIPALFLGGLIPGRTKAAPARNRTLLLNRFFIAGFQFYDGPAAVRRLKAGSLLTLCAEPKNIYDAHAVEIFYDNTKLGYVPRNQNKHITRLLAQDARLSCRVVGVNPGKKPWEMVRAEVLLT